MKKTSKSAGKQAGRRRAVAPLRVEYDFAGGVRGKYSGRVPRGTYLVLLDPDIARQFRSERDVNRALRAYLKDRPR
jgi:hypothetical protein